jgi:transposase
MERSDDRIKKVLSLMSKFFCMTIIKRILCVVLIAFEVEDEAIRRGLGLSYKSFKKYKTKLDSDHYVELLQMGEHRRPNELDDYKGVIFAELDSGAYRTLREIAVMIEKKTGLKRSRNRIQIFLKKNGYKPLKVGFFPGESGWRKATRFLSGNP